MRLTLLVFFIFTFLLPVSAQKFGSKFNARDKSYVDSVKVQKLFFNGLKEKTLGNFDKANGDFTHVLKINPKHHESLYELALISIENDRLEEALELAKEAAKLKTDNIWYLKLEAELFKRLGQFEASGKVYKNILKLFPESLENYFSYATMLVYAGKIDQSIEVFNQIEKRIGLSEEVSIEKQKLHLRNGDFESALGEIKVLSEAYPIDPKYVAMLAEMYSANNKDEEAFVLYKRVLKMDSTYAYAHLALADYYMTKGNNVESFKELSLAFGSPDVDIDSKIRILLSYFGMLNDSSSRNDAQFLTQKLMNVHPNEAKAYSITADLLNQMGKKREARDYFLKCISFDATKFEIWQELIFIDTELNDWDSVVNHTESAAEYFPNQPLIYFYMGVGYNQTGKSKKAVSALNSALSMDSENPRLTAELYSQLGEAHHNLKDHDKSDKAYEKALKAIPNNAVILNNYSYYLSLRKEKLEEAKALSAQANKLEPNQASYEDTYGWILYQMGDYENARIWIEKALRNGGGKSSVILEHYGDVLYKLGDQSLSLVNWKKAKENGGNSALLDKKITEKKLTE
ncbi:MAG: tetratricopeptide (TPR) repeat protein [Sphingobacteriales bacterium]|jgi:tetratricopeptide (TPR) repeat protein